MNNSNQSGGAHVHTTLPPPQSMPASSLSNSVPHSITIPTPPSAPPLIPPPSAPGATHSTSRSTPTTTTSTSVNSTAAVTSTSTSSAAVSTASSRPLTNSQTSHSSNKHDQKPDSRPASRPSSGPTSRPNSRPSSRPADHRSKNDAKDDIMIVGSKEATHRPPPSAQPSHIPHSMPGMVMHHPAGALMPPHTMASANSLERARLMNSAYAQGPAMWNDPFRGAMDPYRQMAANNEALAAARYELLAREHMRDPLRDSLDRAREEHLLRSNPLGSLILSERYREHQAREMFERERQLAAAAAGFYPSTSSSLLPPHPQHLLGHQLKSSPLGHPGHHGLHPHSHPGFSGLHPGHHPGLPLAPGLPPPLISSRPADKKDEPR